jgi:hypothetical protein
MAKKPKAAKASAKAPAADEAKGTALVAMPKATALSLDAGMNALRFIAALSDDEAAIEERRESLASNRYGAQTTLAYAIWKAAKNDAAIQLEASLSDDKAAKNKLGKQIRLALGLSEIVQKGAKESVEWTKDAQAVMFQVDGDDARTVKRKESIRTNFSTMLTKCMRVALDAIDNNLKVEIDKAEKTLRLTGPAIKSHFGEASVVLNEDQNIKLLDKKGAVIGTRELKVKPSFTEIARRAAEAHGKALVARKDSRTQTVDPMKHLVGLCTSIVKAVEKLPKEVPAEVVKALESVYNAIGEVIE